MRTYVHYRKRTGREHPSEQLPDRVLTAEDSALRLALFDALRQLSTKDRAIIVLRYWEDRSVEDTAFTLGLRSGVVRTRSMRALARLRTMLGNDLTALI